MTATPPPIRNAPSGVSPDRLIGEDLERILHHTRAWTSPYQYVFTCTLPTTLYRTATVQLRRSHTPSGGDRLRASVRRGGLPAPRASHGTSVRKRTRTRAERRNQSAYRPKTKNAAKTAAKTRSKSRSPSSPDLSVSSGVVDENPLNDFLLPLAHKHVTVRWTGGVGVASVAYKDLAPALTRDEERLRRTMLATLRPMQGVRGGAAPAYRATLRGALLRVACKAQAHAEALHAVVVALYPTTTSPVRSVHDAEATLTHTEFYATGLDEERNRSRCAEGDVAVRYHAPTPNERTPTNRRRFGYTLRTDPWLREYAAANLAQREPSRARVSRAICEQPAELTGAEVVVPRADTKKTVVHYARARILRVDVEDPRHVWVTSHKVPEGVKAGSTSRSSAWRVPVAHVHPRRSCVDIRRGAKVFVWGEGPAPPPVPRQDVTHIRLATVIDVAPPNHELHCGFPGQAPIVVNVPSPPTDVSAWHRRLRPAFGEGVRVTCEKGRVCFRCRDRRRFTVWSTSSALALLGFVAGRTYEAAEDDAREASGYVLVAPEPLRREPSKKRYGVATTPSLVRDTPSFLVVGTCAAEASARPFWCTGAALVPVRPQYSAETTQHTYLSPYQEFPLHFLTPERPQRGLLLFHETGSGKSRTAIEMAQRHVERRHWEKSDPIRSDDTKRATQAPHEDAYAVGSRPRVFLFSPKQEAAGHFATEIGQWSGCRWSRVKAGVRGRAGHDGKVGQGVRAAPQAWHWTPAQHVYSQFDADDLHREMRAHEEAVGRFLMAYVYLTIVYTNNTKRLYDVVRVIRQAALTRRPLSPAQRRMVHVYFRASATDTTFDVQPQDTPDAFFARVFADGFAIVDEMHQLTNEIANAVKTQKGDDGAGTFFYRALMEASHCRLVGLTGTPMSGQPLSFAPLFNLLSGKEVRCTVEFDETLPIELRRQLFAEARPFMATVWVDLSQSAHSRFVFTPWPRRDVHAALFGSGSGGRRGGGWVGAVGRTYAKRLRVTVRDYELFPFAFHYPSAHAAHKAYVFANTSFEAQFVRNGRLLHASDLARRIQGLVSYISPPKSAPAGSAVVDRSAYPHHEIRTVNLAATPSHMAYLSRIQRQQRAINQVHTQTEQRSGCNVNWAEAPAEALRVDHHQYEGMAKLFLKGGKNDDGVSLQQAEEQLERQWHRLLGHAHLFVADYARHPAIAACLDVNDRLSTFAPKMYSIVRTIAASPGHKAVVYSAFIDGVGTYGDVTRGASRGANPTRAVKRSRSRYAPARSPSLPTSRAPPLPSPPAVLDIHHVGLSGLGLLGHVLVRNGFVRVECELRHPFEPVWALCRAFRARLVQRVNDTRPLTYEGVVALCEAVGGSPVALTAEARTALRRDVRWTTLQQAHGRAGAGRSRRWTIGRLCRQFVLSPQAFPYTCLPENAVVWRQGFAPATRAAFGARASSRPTFMEYSERSIVNRDVSRVSSTVLKRAKEQLLHLYNMRGPSDKEAMRAHWTAEAISDMEQWSRTASNAHGAFVQVLLASTGVTESVEFKDVRTMHILEPPEDYRKLEQMFGRVIRRGSHRGLPPAERDVVIRLYVLAATPQGAGSATSLSSTSDEKYWKNVIQRKYAISHEFYQVMKHMAVDCRSNLVLNSASPQDRELTCFEYPFAAETHDAGDAEAPLFAVGGYEATGEADGGMTSVDLGWVWGE